MIMVMLGATEAYCCAHAKPLYLNLLWLPGSTAHSNRVYSRYFNDSEGLVWPVRPCPEMIEYPNPSPPMIRQWA
jgi:hypothetical protein